MIRAMRKAAGNGMTIMVDYNQCLTPAEAIERLRVLDDEGLAWVEEPTLAHDYAGHAMIAREARTPIQCGENWWGVQDLQHALDAGASDNVMPDVMKIGGVTGWMRAAALAHAKGVRVSSHLWPEISAQLLCCTPDGTLARVRRLVEPHHGQSTADRQWRSRHQRRGRQRRELERGCCAPLCDLATTNSCRAGARVQT